MHMLSLSYYTLSSRIFENVTVKWTSTVRQLFLDRTQGSHYKTLLFPLLLSSFSLFLFLISFSFVSVISSFSGAKTLPFDLLSLK